MLVVHRADRADGLADALSALLARPLADPFTAEVVAVPTRGMERWLTQSVSAVLGAGPGRGDGVCANVSFPFPHRLLGDAVAAASGVDPAEDPWLPERAAWTLLDVVGDSLAETWLATLAAYLGRPAEADDPVRRGRRLTIVRHLARLFDHYALHRPAMIEAWAAGRDCDAGGGPLAPTSIWQAELWRRLRARIGLASPAERRRRACERLLEAPDLALLPDRVSLFGLTRLPAGHLEILRALAHARDVHLFLLHPSPALWTKVGPTAVGAPAGLLRSEDPSAAVTANPMLASWGRDAREMQMVLSDGDALADDHPNITDPAGEPTRLLARIQDDIRHDRALPGPPLSGRPDVRLELDRSDRSIQIHACHGRARQVEVVRDAILHALAQDESLEPRDVIVMCPDIETYAPLVQATFGAGEYAREDEAEDGIDAVPAHLRPVDLRVRLADRSLRQTNPVLAVVSELLELAERRVTASEVLDLADRGPVRRRFRLDDDDLTQMQSWIAQSGIRWGLDAAHRERFRLGGVSSGTWSEGLRRVLLGVTMTDDDRRLFEGVLPLDDVDSRGIDLAGRLAELIERLGTALDALGRPQPLADWARAIGEAADALTATPNRERWQRAELQRTLDDMLAEAASGSAVELAPAEIQAYLLERLGGRPTRANFRTGHLTVCTLMPMRSVPHRVVCLLGLDDGAFPRKTPRDGDDLMLADPHVGERDPRSEDRQLLLDALMAATERLIITFTGNDERTNTPRPAAVPVNELLDTIDATARDGSRPPLPARSRVLVRHPLQPFDPRNFERGALVPGTPWSFDRGTLEGARALTAPRTAVPEFLTAPLPPRAELTVELEDVVRFVEHPVRAFLRQRLGISLRTGEDEIEDALPVELDGLERWKVGQRLLESLLAGVDGRTAYRAEIARGMLPPERLGEVVIRTVLPIASMIADRAAQAAPAELSADPVDVRVELAGGRRLTGTVSGCSGDVLLSATYSRVAAKHRLAAWVRFLAVTASCPERAFSAVTVGRATGRDDVRMSLLEPLAIDSGAAPAQRRGGARDARRPIRPRHARTAATVLRHLGRLRGGGPQRAGRGGRSRSRVGHGVPLREGGPRA